MRIELHLNSEVIKVENKVVIFRTKDEELEVTFDMIAECVGVKSNVLDFLEYDNVLTVGDAEKPLNVINAVWTAYRKCRLI